ncbi:50S ribosomal protein L13 [Candidatus Sumerlaeota bacterium]|nr:50S ribosomal protein L13 [Candidatus Sumerlaeota bacterium]
MKTHMPKPAEVEEKWWLVDAEDQIVGRLAARIAKVLLGKTRPTYAPHIKNGDCVVVINAEKVVFTGRKLTQKVYHRHTGYPSGGRETTPQRLLEKKPEEILRLAVWGMMPKTRLGRSLMKRLRIFAGPQHDHAAQKPQPLPLKTRRARTEEN